MVFGVSSGLVNNYLGTNEFCLQVFNFGDLNGREFRQINPSQTLMNSQKMKFVAKLLGPLQSKPD